MIDALGGFCSTLQIGFGSLLEQVGQVLIEELRDLFRAPGARSTEDTLTGDQIRALRESYGLDVRQWAEILGVSLSTSYRWEQQGAAGVPVDPGSDRMLRLLKQHPEPDRRALGEKIANTLAAGGALRALHLVLRELLPGARAART